MGLATVPALTSSVALKRFATVAVPLAPICSISFGLFGELAVIRKSGRRKPTKEGLLIVKVTVLLIVQLPVKFTVRTTGYTPTVVGVPEITRFVGSVIDKPGGNPVALNDCALPVTVTVYVNARPIVPVASPLLMLWLLHAALPVTALARRKSNGKTVLTDEANWDQEPVDFMAVWARQGQQIVPPNRARPLCLSC
jgi:hypothetical protein